MNAIRRISILAATAAAFLLGGCEQRTAQAPPAAGGESSGPAKPAAAAKADAPKPAGGNEIVIAVAAPFTGDSSEFGVQIEKGVHVAADEINAAGGIGGRKIRLELGDDQGNPAEALNVATKLAANPEIIAIVGHFNSSCSLAAKEAYAQAKIVMFSPGSTNVTVTQNTDYVFRNIFTDDFQGQSLATYAAKMLGVKRVAILFDNDDYGTGLKESFKKKAAELGLVIEGETPYSRDQNDFRSQLTTIKARNPELILIAGLYKQAAVIADQARRLGLNTQLIGGDGLFSQQFIALGGAATEGALVTCPFLFDLGGERARKFGEAFRKKYNRDPDAWAALSYDALNIIAEGLRKNGVSRDAVLRHLQGINSPATAYDGLTGKTFFDKEGDSRKPVQVATVKGGKFVAATKQLSVDESAPGPAPAAVKAAEPPKPAPPGTGEGAAKPPAPPTAPAAAVTSGAI